MYVEITLILVLIEFGTQSDCLTGLDSNRNFFWDIFPRIQSKRQSSVSEKGKTLNMKNWIESLKYPVEEHHIITEDGYILSLFRIPKPGHQPVLLVHGLMTSSASFVIMGSKNSLALHMYEKGYDVWLADTRGNQFSKNHTTLDQNDGKFWSFSFHEIGFYDLPPLIDHVVNTTSFYQIIYIGHSQGATAFFVMCSMRPEYNEKISTMHAIAPIVYLNNVSYKSSLIKKIRDFLKEKSKEKQYEIFGRDLTKSECLEDRDECLENLEKLFGPSIDKSNQLLNRTVLSNFPSGGSIQQIQHYMQIFKSGDFCSFDYGITKNLQIYGQVEPILYNLTKITIPVILHYGQRDRIATPKDIHKFYKMLNATEGLYANSNFNHFDFILSSNSSMQFYEKITKLLDDFNNGTLKYVIE